MPFLVWFGALTICFLSLAALQARAQVTKGLPGDPIKIDSGLVSGTKGAAGVKMYSAFLLRHHPCEKIAGSLPSLSLTGMAS